MFGSSFDTTLLSSSSHCYYPHRCRQCVSWWAQYLTFCYCWLHRIVHRVSLSWVIMCFCSIDLLGDCTAERIVTPLFPDLSHDQRPLSAPLYSVYKWSPRESVHRFFLSGASILKDPILIGGRIWKWSYGWWILQMATCFIKVKNNAELDLHVAKYDKKLLRNLHFFIWKENYR